MFGRGRTRVEERDRAGRMPLHYAVVDGRDEDVRALLDGGGDIEAEDLEQRRPLHFAGIHQRAAAIGLLLGAGAQVDPQDAKGNTPLFYATTYSRGEGDCIVALLRAGADRHVTNAHGHSPLEASQVIANVDLARWFPDEA